MFFFFFTFPDLHIAFSLFDHDKAGSISLSGNPILLQGASRISGAEHIIFNRSEGKFRTEGGQPKIEFYSQKSTGLDIFGCSPLGCLQTLPGPPQGPSKSCVALCAICSPHPLPWRRGVQRVMAAVRCGA